MTETKRPLKVFLSYASQDRPVVRELARRLAGEGWIDPWIDEKKLLPGQDWRTKIEEAVETSDIVIICLSSNSVTKEGYVQKELRYAREIALEKLEESIFLIPLRLDECQVPRGLRFYQWVDYFGEKKDESYSALIESLKLRHEQKLILEEQERARQEKESLEREAVEKALRDKAERERTEKAAREKSERETVEKARKEKAGREKAKRDAAEKAKREGAERRDAQIAAVKETLSKFFNKLRFALSKAMPFLRIGGIIGIIFVLFWVGSWAMSQIISLTPTAETSVTIASSNFPIPSTKTIEPNTTATITRTSAPQPTSIVFNPHPDPSDYIDDFGVPMRLVPAGEFMMGETIDQALTECEKFGVCALQSFDDEAPPHRVYLDAFYIDKYEITNMLYKSCVDAGVCQPPKSINSYTRSNYYGNPEFNNYPVIYVDWNSAKIYCEWREARLLTEAEWEKAARGPDGYTYPWGEGLDCDHANYWQKNQGSCTGDTITVGSYENGKSVYSVYDLAGNVWEWVGDWYSEIYYSSLPAITNNPIGPSSGQYRSMRGGSFLLRTYTDGTERSAYRGWNSPSFAYVNIGLRCARDANP